MTEINIFSPVEKPWGIDQLIFISDSTQINRIIINKGGVSSSGKFHRHYRKYNKFYVERGLLKIITKTRDEETEYLIGSNQKLRQVTIYPGHWHRFEALEETICYEIYWSICNKNDIVRE